MQTLPAQKSAPDRLERARPPYSLTCTTRPLSGCTGRAFILKIFWNAATWAGEISTGSLKQ